MKASALARLPAQAIKKIVPACSNPFCGPDTVLKMIKLTDIMNMFEKGHKPPSWLVLGDANALCLMMTSQNPYVTQKN